MTSTLSWFRKQSSPATICLVFLLILGCFLTWMMPMFMGNNFAFVGQIFPRVWTLITYPFANTTLTSQAGPLFALFLALWVLMVGGTLERDHGSRNFWILWFSVTLISVLPLAIVRETALGTLIPVACLTVMWGTRYPDQIVQLLGIVPVPAKYIAMLSTLAVFFGYASNGTAWYIGLLACVGCLISYLYASNRIPKLRYGLKPAVASAYSRSKPTKAEREREDAFLKNVYDREKEREERERLRKLFESNSDL
jgi:membrane associated rhomboid family serine protease